MKEVSFRATPTALNNDSFNSCTTIGLHLLTQLHTYPALRKIQIEVPLGVALSAGTGLAGVESFILSDTGDDGSVETTIGVALELMNKAKNFAGSELTKFVAPDYSDDTHIREVLQELLSSKNSLKELDSMRFNFFLSK